jgi:hypothetical protein
VKISHASVAIFWILCVGRCVLGDPPPDTIYNCSGWTQSCCKIAIGCTVPCGNWGVGSKETDPGNFTVSHCELTFNPFKTCSNTPGPLMQCATNYWFNAPGCFAGLDQFPQTSRCWAFACANGSSLCRLFPPDHVADGLTNMEHKKPLGDNSNLLALSSGISSTRALAKL